MNNTIEIMEKLEVEEELEQIETAVERYSFPVVSIGDYSVIFSAACDPLDLWDTGKLKISVTTNYIVFRKAELWEKNTFSVWSRLYKSTHATTLPANLKAKKVRRGSYRLYKYGDDGFAIKRNELLKDEVR